MKTQLRLYGYAYCHSNPSQKRGFWERSLNRRNLKTPAYHVENEAFRRRWRHHKHVISLSEGGFLWGDLDQDQWSKITQIRQSASNEPMNPWPEWIPRFIWCTMIWVILDHWSWSRSPQRTPPQVFLTHKYKLAADCYVSHAWCGRDLRIDLYLLETFKSSSGNLVSQLWN